MNGQHSSLTGEWWTPPEILTPARLLWGFDVDPASCEQANRIVQARRFFTREDDGLKRPHFGGGTAWLNPPSKRGENAAWEWWVEWAQRWQCGDVERLWFVVFNPSTYFAKAQAEANRKAAPTPQQAIRIEFAERVRYLRATPQAELFALVHGYEVEAGEAPPHGSALLLLTDRREDAERVAKAYKHLGDCLLPYRWPERGGGM